MAGGNGQMGEPRFTDAEKLVGLCDAVGEMRDLLVRGFTREDAGINADRGGSSIPYIYFRSDGIRDTLLNRICRYPYVTIWSIGAMAVQIREISDDVAGRIEPEWIPFTDGYARLKLVPGQAYAVLSLGGGGANNASEAGDIRILESQSPIILESEPIGPYPTPFTADGTNASTTPSTIVAAVAGYTTILQHFHLRRTAAGTRLYTIQSTLPAIAMYRVRLDQNETHTVTFPKGQELFASGGIQIVDDNAVASLVDVFMTVKRIVII